MRLETNPRIEEMEKSSDQHTDQSEEQGVQLMRLRDYFNLFESQAYTSIATPLPET